MKNKKWLKLFAVALAVFIMGTGIMSFLSLYELNSPNPFRAAYGAAKILWTDTEHVQIRKNPCVIISKPENTEKRMIAYMESLGYTHVPEDRMGAAFKFRKGHEVQIVICGGNGYYTLWSFDVQWRELEENAATDG